MQILSSGGSTSPANLAAGLMARAAEHSGDRLPEGGGRAASRFSFLAGEEDAPELPDGLDLGYDAVLFHGSAVMERIDVAEDMALLPFEQVRAFVDEEVVHELAPPGAGFHGYPVGRGGGEDLPVAAGVSPCGLRTAGLDPHDAGPFHRRARIVPGSACRGACDARPASCGAVAPHRPVRRATA